MLKLKNKSASKSVLLKHGTPGAVKARLHGAPQAHYVPPQHPNSSKVSDVKTYKISPALQKLQKKITEFSLLEDGWDGYYAKPISSSSITKANKLVTKLLNENITPSFIAPTKYSGVLIEVSNEAKLIKIEIKGDGKLSCLFLINYKATKNNMETLNILKIKKFLNP